METFQGYVEIKGVVIFIDKFVFQCLQSPGLLNPSRYTFSMSGPVTSIISGMRESMNVSAVNWPGKSIDTIDKHIPDGPHIKIPTGYILEDIPVTFYCSKDLSEWKKINEWMEYMTNDGEEHLLKSWQDCVGQGQLDIRDEAGIRVASLQLIDCYPTVLGPIELAYENTDQVSTFSVDFHFKEYKVL